MSTKGYCLSCNTDRGDRATPRVSSPSRSKGLPIGFSLMSPNGCASSSSHRKAGTRGGMMNAQALVAGIDVSKDWLDVVMGSESLRVANDVEGFTELLNRLHEANVQLVVMEATGGYETQVASAIAGAGL